MLKKIEAIIKPFKLDEVREALTEANIHGMTVTEVTGYGRQKTHAELYSGAEYAIDSMPKIKIEIVLVEDQLQLAIDTIIKAARTGKVGDGKIFVSDIQQIIRIRTGEVDDAAL